MFHKPVSLVLLVLVLTVSYGCAQAIDDGVPVGTDGWLEGNTSEKFEAVARQLRGFDMAMVETGYRFTELYFAGEDENWEYARYQAEKIGTAIRNGLERRPRRAESAQTFLNIMLPEVLAAIESRDLAQFRPRFQQMHSTCVSCHQEEEVAFITVALPDRRLAPVGPVGQQP